MYLYMHFLPPSLPLSLFHPSLPPSPLPPSHPPTTSHMISGALAVQYMRLIVPLHSNRLLGIPFSSNLVFYLLVAMVSAGISPAYQKQGVVLCSPE